ncbi:hypothetical protein ACFV1V_19725 [Streptomyces globisporus]|uniref:hypothetical protein n=1 Tax=Streptomyces globisporus TaxID=1908 RepID=UPI00367A9B1B
MNERPWSASVPTYSIGRAAELFGVSSETGRRGAARRGAGRGGEPGDRRAGPAFDVRRRKDRSRFLPAVTGGDGHHAVLSWAETDADFGDAPVLLATRMDGRLLEPDGSQLVMPRDRCGARYVSSITRV